MQQVEYLDLPEFGLHFVPFHDPRFPDLLNEIMNQPSPFPAPSFDDLENAAILLNESGHAIVIFSIEWRYRGPGERTRTTRLTSSHSSLQLDILCGRLRATEEPYSSILPGSKRLVAERGLFGTNADVLPPAPGGRIGGGGGYGSSGHGAPDGAAAEWTQLVLDSAVFDNGLCVGPDAARTCDSLRETLDRQRAVSAEAAAALRNGSSEGVIFELLLPFARHSPHARGRSHGQNFLMMFGSMAINRLINGNRDDQIAWFDRFATPSTLPLRISE